MKDGVWYSVVESNGTEGAAWWVECDKVWWLRESFDFASLGERYPFRRSYSIDRRGFLLPQEFME